MRAALGLAATALVLVACAPVHGPTGPPRPDPLTPPPPPFRYDRHRAEPAVILDHDDADLVTIDWTFQVLTNSGTRVVFDHAADPCHHAVGVIVTETDTSVEIAVRADPAGTECLAIYEVAIEYVTLAEPLGDRTLLHAPVG